MNNDKETVAATTLPAAACLPINRCSLPPQILGGLTFQQHPARLAIDGVAQLHRGLFDSLERIDDAEQRGQRFMDYMVVLFRLHRLEDAGYDETEQRGKADYLRLLRGWLFDTDGREAAVLKGWVESRFGLSPRYHHAPLQDPDSEAYGRWLSERAAGLYGTNALEAQLDLVYSYSQYELARRYPEEKRLTLFRGLNHPEQMEVLVPAGKDRTMVALLNNLNSFSRTRERAEEFGDYILEAEVPWQKVLFYSRLLPGRHIGEDEYLVIGGVYRLGASYW